MVSVSVRPTRKAPPVTNAVGTSPAGISAAAFLSVLGIHQFPTDTHRCGEGGEAK
jgi:hypothetical protein